MPVNQTATEPDENLLAALRMLGRRFDPQPARLRVDALAAFSSRTTDTGVRFTGRAGSDRHGR